MELTEDKIIQACQSGNMELFALLYDRYAEKIYKFLYFRTLHKETAEDLSSQVFFQALNKIKSYQVGKGTFQAWLYKIAQNALIDEFRKRKPVESIDSHINIADNTDLESETEATLSAEKVQEILNTLPEESRQLLTMRLWDELTYAEISEILGKTEGSLKMQFSRTISKLQEQTTLLLLFLIIMRW